MMNKGLWTGLIAIALISCNSSSTQPGKTPLGSVYEQKPVVAVVPKKLCFLNVRNQDTVRVSLTINGTLVDGQMDIMPFGKDGRRGSLAGTIDVDVLHLRWIYQQEGISDTARLELQLTDDGLHPRNDTTYGSIIPITHCP